MISVRRIQIRLRVYCRNDGYGCMSFTLFLHPRFAIHRMLLCVWTREATRALSSESVGKILCCTVDGLQRLREATDQTDVDHDITGVPLLFAIIRSATARAGTFIQPARAHPAPNNAQRFMGAFHVSLPNRNQFRDSNNDITPTAVAFA